MTLRLKGQDAEVNDVPRALEHRSAEYQKLIDQAVARWRRNKVRRAVIVRASQVLLLVIIIGGWEYASRNVLENADLFYGSPSGVVDYLVEMRGDLFVAAVATIRASLIGFVVGAVTGVVAGLALGRWSVVDRIVDPYLTMLMGMPRIALAPLFLLWFGIGDMAKVVLAVSLVFFLVLYNTRAGVKSVQPDLQTVAHLLGANQRQVFWKVVLPSATPVLFAAFRLGMVFSVLAVIASEMIAARDGLGVTIVSNGQLLRPNGVFAALAILAFMMAIFNGLLQLFERRLQKWAPADSS